MVVIPTSTRIKLSEMEKKKRGSETGEDKSKQETAEVSVEVRITGMKMTRQEGFMRKGKAPTYSAEKLLPILAEMVKYYGGMPTAMQIEDYAAEHKGVPKATTFVRYLGLKSTWRERLDAYLEKDDADASGEPNGAVLGEDGSGGADAEEVKAAGTAKGGTEVASGVLTEADAMKARELIPELSGAVNLSVKVNGKKYSFVLDFENLRPVIVENVENKESEEPQEA